MSLYRPNPPPIRNGVSPSCVVTPQGAWATLLDFLVQRFTSVPASAWAQRLSDGDVVDDHGQVITTLTPFAAGRRLYYYRALPVETHIPFEAVVLWQDEHLLVVDKPHFLPVVPSGKYLQQTVLVRLKNALGIDALSPIHRIDRDTAGLVLFSNQVASRGAYQNLFRSRQVDKAYECIAPWNPDLPWPLTRESRVAPAAHFMQQTEVAGPPNAITHIHPLEVQGAWARYALKPVTGQRHQLRVHMTALGLPIRFDGIYPTLTPEGSADFERPLQLLARSIAFTDPLTGAAHRFESRRRLLALTDIKE
ncbi:MAG: pseudouridine synthase [Burkholderiales bacterium]|nr:pseudouridine synthase [Burkholderiales bacterium]